MRKRKQRGLLVSPHLGRSRLTAKGKPKARPTPAHPRVVHERVIAPAGKIDSVRNVNENNRAVTLPSKRGLFARLWSLTK
jgi:hypothetical protein